MYLLDSNAWITFLRKPLSPLVGRLESKATNEICTCSVVLAELFHGCLKSAKPTANRAKVDALIAPYDCYSFEEKAANEFAAIRSHLESLGTPIGPLDMQIAAIARISDFILVTHNTAEFSRIPGLKLEDWELP